MGKFKKICKNCIFQNMIVTTGSLGKNPDNTPKTPKKGAKPRKSVTIKDTIVEDSVSEFSEVSNDLDDEGEDEVFNAEDIEKEVSLCQLINETFKFDKMDDDELMELNF